MSYHNKQPITQKQQLILGYAELTAAQFCVGFNVITGKLLINYFPIFFLLTTRFIIGFAAMFIVANFAGIRITSIVRRFLSLTSRDKLLLVLQAACGGFLFNLFILYGMKSTSATSAGIITSVTPGMIFILSAIILREKITVQQNSAIFVALIGLIILNTNKPNGQTSDSLLGNLLVFLAVLPEALFTILSKFMTNKLNQIETVTLVNFINLLMFVPFLGIDIGHLHLSEIHLNIWGIIFLYGISGGMMFFLLWYRGLSKINANIAALFTGIMPISTAILAFLLLNEPCNMKDCLGMFFVVLAIFVGCYQKAPAIKNTELMGPL